MESHFEEPLVSIIIPTYQRNKQLVKCLESIQQSEYDNIETIVVDGTSDRQAKSIVESFNGVFYKQQTHGEGPSPARAEGLNKASGKYVHFLDDDDVLLTGAIKKKVSLLENREEVGVAYSGIIWDRGHEIYGGIKNNRHTLLPDKDGRGNVLKQALAFQLVPCSNSVLLIRRDLLEEIFPLGEGAKDDLWMVVELAQMTEFDFVEEALVLRHDSESSEGRSLAAIEEQFLVLKQKAQLYEELPDWVRKNALSDTYRLKGLIYLENSNWSSVAVVSFFKSFYFKPGFSFLHFGMFVGSMFGSKIWFKLANLYVELIFDDGHTGNI